MNKWNPANSNIGPYTKKNYSAQINITGGTQSNKFKEVVVAAENIGQNIGTSSSFGTVKELGKDHKYVMKTMKFNITKNIDYLKIFLNEIRVGRMPDINKVGPKIYAWRIIRDLAGVAIKGQYIMDNFLKGDSSLKVYSATQYVRKTFGNTCPPKSHPYFIKLRELLEKFWKITKGYHGDLHMSNIAVVTKPNGDIERLIIFDYGAHKKFKTNVSSVNCFEDFIHIIDKEFMKSVNKLSSNFHPSTSKIPVVFPNRSQPRRPNTNMLRGLKPSGNAIRHKFSESIMRKLRKSNKPENIITRFSKNNIKNQNAFATYSHRNAFLSPNNWNKAVGWTRPGNRLIAKYTEQYSQPNKELLKSYKIKPLNIYYKPNLNFPNLPPNKQKEMMNNLGLPIFNPVKPRNRITRIFNGKHLKKNNILKKISKPNFRKNFINMPNNKFNEMINNYEFYG